MRLGRANPTYELQHYMKVARSAGHLRQKQHAEL
jgi:hypothetical protein